MGRGGTNGRSQGGSEMDWVALESAATALGSAAAVVYAKRQLKAGHDQARTAFEDNLEREYRQIAADIPVWALLGAELASPSRTDGPATITRVA